MKQFLSKSEKLILVGAKVKQTLAETYVMTTNRCHIDWVSLTLKKSVLLQSDFYNSHCNMFGSHFDQDIDVIQKLNRKLTQITGFKVGMLRPGRNYYKHSETLVNDQGEEVGCVSGGGHSQRDTFNIILRGTACTFAAKEWQKHLHDFALPLDATLARIDLALDFFEGENGGVEAVRKAYLDGAFDYNGRRPTSTTAGSWDQGHSRTYNIGRRGSKSICAYEKGHAYGMMDSKWWRIEQRFGSQDRVLPLDILINPDKYFAGAYDFNALLLETVQPTKLKTKTELLDITSAAVVKRKLRWLENTVMPSIVHMTLAYDVGEKGFMWVCDLALKHANRELPRSLRQIPQSHLRSAIKKTLQTPLVPAELVAS